MQTKISASHHNVPETASVAQRRQLGSRHPTTRTTDPRPWHLQPVPGHETHAREQSGVSVGPAHGTTTRHASQLLMATKVWRALANGGGRLGMLESGRSIQYLSSQQCNIVHGCGGDLDQSPRTDEKVWGKRWRGRRWRRADSEGRVAGRKQ